MKLKNILQAVLLSAIVILSSCKKDKDATPGPLDCAGVEYGIAAADDCGVCHSSYMYDMITHQSTPVGTYADTVGMSGMFVLAGSTMDLAANPMWNASCYLFTDSEGASTVAYGGQTARLNMASELGSALSSNVTEAMLNDMFMNTNSPFADADLNASTKNIGGKTASAAEPTISASEQAAVITAIQGWFSTYANEVAPISGGNAVDNPASAGVPGFIDNRELDGKGLEYDQVVIKTLIGALCLQQVAHDYLTKMDVDNVERNPDSTGYAGQVCTKREHYYDEAFGYVYGMDADPLTAAFEEIAGNKYEFLGKYLAKHNANNQYSGVDYVNIVYDAFKMGRAAVVAECEDELNAQIDIINNALSDVVAWHAEGYLRSSTNYLDSLGNISSPSYFHYVSEAWGFVRALEFTKSTNYTFSATDVQNMITTLDANGAGAWGLTDAHLIGLADEIQAKTGLPTATSFTNLVGLE